MPRQTITNAPHSIQPAQCPPPPPTSLPKRTAKYTVPYAIPALTTAHDIQKLLESLPTIVTTITPQAKQTMTSIITNATTSLTKWRSRTPFDILKIEEDILVELSAFLSHDHTREEAFRKACELKGKLWGEVLEEASALGYKWSDVVVEDDE